MSNFALLLQQLFFEFLHYLDVLLAIALAFVFVEDLSILASFNWLTANILQVGLLYPLFEESGKLFLDLLDALLHA